MGGARDGIEEDACLQSRRGKLHNRTTASGKSRALEDSEGGPAKSRRRGPYGMHIEKSHAPKEKGVIVEREIGSSGSWR